jgi:hypothetical protein
MLCQYPSRKKKARSEKLDELMSPKSCTSNHKKIRHWNAIFFMEYYGHARSRRHSLEEIYATLYPENISPVTYALGERKHINSACDTEVHSIRVECARVKPPFRPVYIHSAPSCGVPITHEKGKAVHEVMTVRNWREILTIMWWTNWPAHTSPTSSLILHTFSRVVTSSIYWLPTWCTNYYLFIK